MRRHQYREFLPQAIMPTTITGMNAPRRKTCKRYDVPGDSHFITFSCFRRLPLLAKDRARQWLLDALAHGRAKGQFHLWAYVVMPEHVHVVIWPQVARISTILTTIKQSTAKTALMWSEAPEGRLRNWRGTQRFNRPDGTFRTRSSPLTQQ